MGRRIFPKEDSCANSELRHSWVSKRRGCLKTCMDATGAGMKNGTGEVDQGFVVGIHGGQAGEQHDRLECRRRILLQCGEQLD